MTLFPDSRFGSCPPHQSSPLASSRSFHGSIYSVVRLMDGTNIFVEAITSTTSRSIYPVTRSDSSAATMDCRELGLEPGGASDPRTKVGRSNSFNLQPQSRLRRVWVNWYAIDPRMQSDPEILGSPLTTTLTTQIMYAKSTRFPRW